MSRTVLLAIAMCRFPLQCSWKLLQSIVLVQTPQKIMFAGVSRSSQYSLSQVPLVFDVILISVWSLVNVADITVGQLEFLMRTLVAYSRRLWPACRNCIPDQCNTIVLDDFEHDRVAQHIVRYDHGYLQTNT